MQIVLLEKVGRLGGIGDVVTVKNGYARNFLLPRNKALRATKSNLAVFEAEKATLEKASAQRQKDAEKLAKVIEGKTVAVIRAASESGQLYGSVSTRDISNAVSTLGETVARDQVVINQSFKILGLFPVTIQLHPEVTAEVIINIARSEDEAAIQEKEGRALISTSNFDDDEDEYVPSPAVEATEETSEEEADAESAEAVVEETTEEVAA